MEIIVRLVNGGLKVQTNLQSPLEVLGLLEIAKAEVLRQMTQPKPGVAMPTTEMVTHLVGGR